MSYLLEMLESVNIQNTDEHFRPTRSIPVLSCQTVVNDGYQPLKQTSIDEFRNAVTDNGGLSGVERRDDFLISCDDLLLHRPLLEVGEIDTQEARG